MHTVIQAIGAEEVDPEEKKRPRRYGGAFRAFVHHRSKARKFTAGSLSQMAQDYRDLSEEDRVFFQDLGKQATVLNRRMEPAYPAYSHTAQQNQRRRWKHTLSAGKAQNCQIDADAAAGCKEMETNTLEGRSRVCGQKEIDEEARLLRQSLAARQAFNQEKGAGEGACVEAQSSERKCFGKPQHLTTYALHVAGNSTFK